MTQHTPQILVTLSPAGKLVLELPGSQATRRQLQVRDGELAETLHRILTAQLQQQTEIGLDGAPTQAQVQHWERHGIWADSRCRFCLAEGRAKPDHSQFRVRRKEVVYKTPAGVEVRTIKSGLGGARVLQAKRNAKDMGL
jgi:hypothetical protein